MDGYLSNKPTNFVDDPEKLYRLRRHEAQAKKQELADADHVWFEEQWMVASWCDE
jgi:hypothetical protein